MTSALNTDKCLNNMRSSCKNQCFDWTIWLENQFRCNIIFRSFLKQKQYNAWTRSGTVKPFIWDGCWGTLESSYKKITCLNLSVVPFGSLKGSFKMQCIGIHSKLCVSVYGSIKIKSLAVSKQLCLNVQTTLMGCLRPWSVTHRQIIITFTNSHSELRGKSIISWN